MKRLSVCLALAVLVLARLPAGADPGPGPAPVHLDAPPAADAAGLPSLVYWSETLMSPRPLRLHILRIDLGDDGLELCTILGGDPDGDGPAEATLESPLTLASRHGAIGAVNANAFRHLPDASPEERRRGWYAGKAVDIAGLAAADGTLRSQPDSSLPNLWTDAAGAVRIGEVAEAATVRHGVAAWIDHLLADDQVVARPSNQIHPRTLAGVDATGRIVLLAVADGRQRGVSEGLTLPEAAEIMRQRGCRHAVNLDGGGSSILVVRPDPNTDQLVTVNRPSDGRPRPIPAMLGVRRRTVAADAP